MNTLCQMKANLSTADDLSMEGMPSEDDESVADLPRSQETPTPRGSSEQDAPDGSRLGSEDSVVRFDSFRVQGFVLWVSCVWGFRAGGFLALSEVG